MDAPTTEKTLDLAPWNLTAADEAVVRLISDSGKITQDELITLIDLWNMECTAGGDLVTYLTEHRILRASFAKALGRDGAAALQGVRAEVAISLVALKVKLRVCQIQHHHDPDSSSTSFAPAVVQLAVAAAPEPSVVLKPKAKSGAKLRIVNPASSQAQSPAALPPPHDTASTAETLNARIAKLPVTACVCSSCEQVIQVQASQAGSAITCPACSAATTVPGGAFAPGAVVQGDYIVRQQLGLGANGIVYLALQRSLHREVALKVLFPTADDGLGSFHAECRTLAQLQHGNIVQAYNASEIDGCGVLAMEYVRGSSLEDHIMAGNSFDLPYTLVTIGQLADALEYAWDETRVVHRDIKPGNILIDERDRPKLADFGLALSRSKVQFEGDDRIHGTPAYMAPENITGEILDFHADMYSLGIIFYQMLTGVHPFHQAESAREMLQDHLHTLALAPSLNNPKVTPEIDALALRMLAKDPADRHETYDDLIQDIRASLVAVTKASPGMKSSARIARHIFG